VPVILDRLDVSMNCSFVDFPCLEFFDGFGALALLATGEFEENFAWLA
jgi:hypothetical protein